LHRRELSLSIFQGKRAATRQRAADAVRGPITFRLWITLGDARQQCAWPLSSPLASRRHLRSHGITRPGQQSGSEPALAYPSKTKSMLQFSTNVAVTMEALSWILCYQNLDCRFPANINPLDLHSIYVFEQLEFEHILNTLKNHIESWQSPRPSHASARGNKGKIKANRCLLPNVCPHVVFRTALLEGVPSSPKSASNSTLKPAPACYDLNVVRHGASRPAWPRTKSLTSAQEPVAFAIEAPGQWGGRGRFSIRLWLLWPRRTAADCRHPGWAADDVCEAWGSVPRRGVLPDWPGPGRDRSTQASGR
jgi:hypothetical protein